MAIDYDPLPYSQGRITAISADHEVYDVELFDGYPDAGTVRNFKYEVFRPDPRTLRCEDRGRDQLPPVKGLCYVAQASSPASSAGVFARRSGLDHGPVNLPIAKTIALDLAKPAGHLGAHL